MTFELEMFSNHEEIVEFHEKVKAKVRLAN
jgi:hypothetical protein